MLTQLPTADCDQEKSRWLGVGDLGNLLRDDLEISTF